MERCAVVRANLIRGAIDMPAADREVPQNLRSSARHKRKEKKSDEEFSKCFNREQSNGVCRACPPEAGCAG